MYCQRKSNNLINKIHEKALRIAYDDYVSDFDSLLEEDESVTIHQRNIQVLASRVGDMSRTFNRLFVVINMLTQISHTCLRARKIFLLKEEQGIPFSTTKIPLMWTPHYNNVKHAIKRYQTRKQVRGGEKNSMAKGRPKSIGMWDISNIRVSNQYYSF